MKAFPLCRTAALAALLGLGSTLTHAQGADPAAPPPAPEAAAAAPSFSDSQLKSFIATQSGLQEVRTEYSGLLERTEDAAEAADLQQQATQKMITVIEDEGLEVDTYNQIAVALQEDTELRARIESMLEQPQ